MSVGVHYTDGDLIDLIIYKLLARFRNFVTSYKMTTEIAQPSLTTVCGQLRHHEQIGTNLENELENAFSSEVNIQGRGNTTRGNFRGSDRGRI